MKTNSETAATTKAVSQIVAKICKAGDEAAAATQRLYDEHIAKLKRADGTIDTKSGAFQVLQAAVRAAVDRWYISAPRVIDGVVHEPAALASALKSKSGALWDGANSACRVKTWRMMSAHLPKREAAPAGNTAQVAKVALARSKAAKGKGKAAPAKPVEAALTVPQLLDKLQAALAALKPNSRIVHATEIRNRAEYWVREARTAMDGVARTDKAAKPTKRGKAAKPVAPAPVAVQ